MLFINYICTIQIKQNVYFLSNVMESYRNIKRIKGNKDCKATILCFLIKCNMASIINNNEKSIYTAPTVEVLEIGVEAGIASSPGALGEGGDLPGWQTF